MRRSRRSSRSSGRQLLHTRGADRRDGCHALDRRVERPGQIVRIDPEGMERVAAMVHEAGFTEQEPDASAAYERRSGRKPSPNSSPGCRTVRTLGRCLRGSASRGPSSGPSSSSSRWKRSPLDRRLGCPACPDASAVPAWCPRRLRRVRTAPGGGGVGDARRQSRRAHRGRGGGLGDRARRHPVTTGVGGLGAVPDRRPDESDGGAGSHPAWRSSRTSRSRAWSLPPTSRSSRSAWRSSRA